MLITKAVLLIIAILVLMIGTLVVGGTLIGGAMGSPKWESKNSRVRQQALFRLILGMWGFLAICWAFKELLKVLPY